MMMNNDFMVALNQLKANPRQFLSQHIPDLPEKIPNNPLEIIQLFLNKGWFKQGQVNQMMQMRKQFMK